MLMSRLFPVWETIKNYAVMNFSCIYIYISLNVYAFLLGIYLGLEFLCHNVCIYATVLVNAKQFSKMVLLCIFCYL